MLDIFCYVDLYLTFNHSMNMLLYKTKVYGAQIHETFFEHRQRKG